VDGGEGTSKHTKGAKEEKLVLTADGRRWTQTFSSADLAAETGLPSGQQIKIIRQDLQDCAESLFLRESADEKHVNLVNPV
jgi:hypothetical protein